MAERIDVRAPDLREELRQLAEAIADLHYALGLIVENGKELVPGEAVEELNRAWSTSAGSMQVLVNNLLGRAAGPSRPIRRSDISPETLQENELSGDVGKIKRSMLSRLKDRFFSYWYSEPRTDEKRTKAGEAAVDWLELGATTVSSIPGYEKVVEFLSLTKQLVGLRVRRGF